MNPGEALAEGRRAAESMMTDTLKVTRKSSDPVTDPATGKVTYPSTTIYPTADEDGRGRVQANALQDREVTTGGADFSVAAFTVQVPYHVDLRSGDQAEVIASQTDSLMVGRKFLIDTVPRKTHAIMLRASAEEVT